MVSLTNDYRRTQIVTPRKLLSGLDATLDGMGGRQRGGPVAAGSFMARAAEIDAHSKKWEVMTDDELGARLQEFRDVFRRRRRGHRESLPDAVAAVREAAARKAGLRPYAVQIAGMLALYEGFIAEMATGEGKTLTAAVTSVLNAWSGFPCHVITVNDYLAGRDAEWFAPLYRFCGVSVGCVTGHMEPRERREQYDRDLVYTTSKEMVADFLRDRIHLGNLQNFGRRNIGAMLGREDAISRGLVMKGIHTAIVDEADSILIDEAVTPLIISRAEPNDPFVEACRVTSELSGRLQEGKHYRIDRKYKDIDLEPAIDDVVSEVSWGMRGLTRGLVRRRDLVRQALTAREFFHKDREYVIQDGKVVIVDEFTGRLMPQRTWRAGLHQFIEAKEALEITPPSETLARLSFQRFFRFFKRLSGMTGTAQEADSEFWHIYRLPVVSIPLNKPCLRTMCPARIYADADSKWRGVFEEIVMTHLQERPVLVGTRSVEASERLGDKLTAAGLPFRLLNAVRHKEEARIVAHAGEKSTITIATNMAGRGTDIKLDPGIAKLGGLHVVATEFHESHRIDRQLFGRCARQGDPGSAVAFASMEDELITRYVPAYIRRPVTTWFGKEGIGSNLAALKLVDLAQERAENLAFKRRKAVLKMDTWLDDSLSFAPQDVM